MSASRPQNVLSVLNQDSQKQLALCIFINNSKKTQTVAQGRVPGQGPPVYLTVSCELFAEFTRFISNLLLPEPGGEQATSEGCTRQLWTSDLPGPHCTPRSGINPILHPRPEACPRPQPVLGAPPHVRGRVGDLSGPFLGAPWGPTRAFLHGRGRGFCSQPRRGPGHAVWQDRGGGQCVWQRPGRGPGDGGWPSSHTAL